MAMADTKEEENPVAESSGSSDCLNGGKEVKNDEVDDEEESE